jgi:hypothetical protein
MPQVTSEITFHKNSNFFWDINRWGRAAVSNNARSFNLDVLTHPALKAKQISSPTIPMIIQIETRDSRQPPGKHSISPLCTDTTFSATGNCRLLQTPSITFSVYQSQFAPIPTANELEKVTQIPFRASVKTPQRQRSDDPWHDHSGDQRNHWRKMARANQSDG